MSSSSAGAPAGPGYWTGLYEKARTAPCFRGPLLWGLACGFLTGLHKFRIHRTAPRAILHACDYAVLGMGVSTSIAWWMCVRERRKEEIELRQVLAMQGFKHMSELPEERRDPPQQGAVGGAAAAAATVKEKR